MRPARVFAASRTARGALALCCGALLALPGCGDGNKGDPIPKAQADRMIRLTQLADQNSADGKCSGAAAKVREAQSVLERLPSSVDKDVRQGLAESYNHLLSLIQSECERPQKTDTQTTPTETTPTETTPTTPTQTTPTQTTPTETTPTETTPTTPTTPTETGTSTGTGGTPPGNGGAGQG